MVVGCNLCHDVIVSRQNIGEHFDEPPIAWVVYSQVELSCYHEVLEVGIKFYRLGEGFVQELEPVLRFQIVAMDQFLSSKHEIVVAEHENGLDETILV